jgi:mediator of RNA polymerase II transcription subunit 16
MVLGNTKWALDFSLYILNELFDLADEFESVSSDQEAFNQKRQFLHIYRPPRK